ncbi:hypothetical protein BDF22DRAFT_774341 [Syncephalis plumigaleata]|nr:hypothetical protein BDF22DRAFT_774341 [Syncephalis plumigaleata]
MSITTTTTTTIEISSNSNSSCRLLVCLNSLPFHDQRVFRSLLGHIELLRLSACCRSLRSSIRNDTVLWQALYHRDFLSGDYYTKEMEFVLWCIRTDVNIPCTSDKRADLLENVDWYNTYRRRVSTENNWRYGRCKTTHIDMIPDKDEVRYITEITLSTSPNVLSLDSSTNNRYDYATCDHYIAASPRPIESGTNYNVKILSRKHGGVFTTFSVPAQYEVKAIEGKWVLLVNKSLMPPKNVRIYNSIMCPGNIDDIWDATCFYKTTNNTAIVYTARIVTDDDVDRIEWALYRFSTNNPVVQLRSGWFQLRETMSTDWLIPVASSGQSHIPHQQKYGQT